MGVYIKNWSLADWEELLKWAKIGANNAMIGEFAEVEELPPHGKLIDVDTLDWNYIHIRDDGMKIYTQRAIDNAPTVIPEEGE